MIACISILLLWVQVNFGITLQYGTVSGVLKTEAGTPAAGVRVAAMVQPEDAAASSVLASIAETDETGRYRLEDIPVGRYYIVAGRADGPTYFPGVLDRTAGTVVVVTAGAKAQGIDFVMRPSSVRTESRGSAVATAAGGMRMLSSVLPVKVDSRGKVPVLGPDGEVTIRLTRLSDGAQFDTPIKNPTLVLSALASRQASVVQFQVPAGLESYRVSVERLPQGYTVASMTYGATDLLTGVLKLDLVVPGLPTTSSSGLAMLASPATLSLTLAAAPSVALDRGGVRVTGRLPGAEINPVPVLLSGNSGVVFADGTFEFRNVPPGRHTVAVLGFSAARRLAASIVVGDRDIDGIQFEETPLLTLDVSIPALPRSAGSRPAGSVVRLASLRGRFVEGDAAQPITNGTVYLIGDRNFELSLDAAGRFEVPHLLPGIYNLEAQIPGYRTLQQSITMDVDDVELSWNLP